MTNLDKMMRDQVLRGAFPEGPPDDLHPAWVSMADTGLFNKLRTQLQRAVDAMDMAWVDADDIMTPALFGMTATGHVIDSGFLFLRAGRALANKGQTRFFYRAPSMKAVGVLAMWLHRKALSLHQKDARAQEALSDPLAPVMAQQDPLMFFEVVFDEARNGPYADQIRETLLGTFNRDSASHTYFRMWMQDTIDGIERTATERFQTLGVTRVNLALYAETFKERVWEQFDKTGLSDYFEARYWEHVGNTCGESA